MLSKIILEHTALPSLVADADPLMAAAHDRSTVFIRWCQSAHTLKYIVPLPHTASRSSQLLFQNTVCYQQRARPTKRPTERNSLTGIYTPLYVIERRGLITITTILWSMVLIMTQPLSTVHPVYPMLPSFRPNKPKPTWATSAIAICNILLLNSKVLLFHRSTQGETWKALQLSSYCDEHRCQWWWDSILILGCLSLPQQSSVSHSFICCDSSWLANDKIYIGCQIVTKFYSQIQLIW